MLRRLLPSLSAAVGFALMALLIHRLAPLRVPEVTPKLAYLQAHPEDFDTLFIGSSRIYHGVSPRAFDAAMAADGTPAHSFNLAINGMMPPESLHMARTVLAMQLPRLRRIFLEVASARGSLASDSPTVRDVYWQDPATLISSWRRAAQDYHALQQKHRQAKAWDDITRSAALFSRNQLNIGRLIPTPDFAANPPDKSPAVILGPDGDGYQPAKHPLTDADLQKLEDGIQAIRNRTVKPDPRDPLNQDAYARIQALAASHGIALILVMAPVTTRDYHASQDAPPGARLLAFDDPDRYPELYLPAHRVDFDHLNDAGARIFSAALADAYLSEK